MSVPKVFWGGFSLRAAPPSRRLSGGRLRPPRRGRDALGTAGKMPALLPYQFARGDFFCATVTIFSVAGQRLRYGQKAQ